jgi:TM2 domain-containing membrane protein YozV
MTSTPVYPNAQAIFYQQYESVRRDEIVGILLALFLGTFGVHHFYLRRTGLGVLYCFFFWSGVPAILGFIECFFMPGRVREFNAIQAAGIAAALGIMVPPWGSPQPINVTVNVPAASAGGFAGAGVAGAPAQPGTQAGTQLGTQVGTLVACPRCQQTNPQGARFCGACGATL